MKKIFLILAAAVMLSSVAWAQTSARSMFIDGFDESKYSEVAVDEVNKLYGYTMSGGEHTDREEKEFEKIYLKVKCHVIFINQRGSRGQSISFYGDDGWTNGSWTGTQEFPENMPLFTSVEVYFRFIRHANWDFNNWGWFNYFIEGWRVLDDIRFVGQKYIATDALRIRKSPSLSAEQVGRLSKGERATVIEVGEKVTIDGIESAWVKIRAKDGTEGWCFAGYLTNGTEYREKPWTSAQADTPAPAEVAEPAESAQQGEQTM